jgi:hypothetical protein
MAVKRACSYETRVNGTAKGQHTTGPRRPSLWTRPCGTRQVRPAGRRAHPALDGTLRGESDRNAQAEAVACEAGVRTLLRITNKQRTGASPIPSRGRPNDGDLGDRRSSEQRSRVQCPLPVCSKKHYELSVTDVT